MGFGVVFFDRHAGCLSACCAAGFLRAEANLALGAAPLAGQFLAMLLMVGPGNLLPLGLIVFGVLAIPPILLARLGAYLRNRVAHGKP